MRLEDVASGAGPVPIAMVGSDKALATELQSRLSVIGLLDPPVDGQFGPVSHWALAAIAARLGMGTKKQLDRELAESILDDQALDLFPVNSPDTFAGRIASAMQARDHWICRHPQALNIVYVEGVDSEGVPNGNVPNEFNDLRLILRINKAGNPEIVDCWDGTTEPGYYHTVLKKLDTNGAARIAFGQFKAWSTGIHNKQHEALVQTGSIKVHRDLNEDFQRDNDQVYEGLFAINQHWGYDMSKKNIGNASAGCLVGRTKSGHRDFMNLCKSDPRYQSNNSYRFITTVLPAEAC